MVDESIPSICKECPQARQNAYTGAWYCVISGAPLGSQRAKEYCTCSKTGVTAAPSSAGVTATPDSGGATATQPPMPSPEPPQQTADPGAASPNPAPQQSATDGAVKQDADVPTDEEIVFGYQYDGI